MYLCVCFWEFHYHLITDDDDTTIIIVVELEKTIKLVSLCVLEETTPSDNFPIFLQRIRGVAKYTHFVMGLRPQKTMGFSYGEAFLFVHRVS